MKEYVFDTVVVGGGVAGVSAAVSAARNGKKVALIERLAMLGGLATAGLINWFEPLCDGKGKQLIYSQADEFLRLAIKYGYKTLDEDWLNKKTGKGRFSTFFDHNVFSLSLVELLNDNNIIIFFETQVTNIDTKNNKIIGLTAYNAEGPIYLKGKNFIDATGSAYLHKMAKVDYFNGINYLTYATIRDNNGNPVFQLSGANYVGTNHPKNCKLFEGNTTENINEYNLKAQLLALNEYKNNEIKAPIMIPAMSQFRKISAVKGLYVLKNDDLYKHHETSIGCIGVFNKPGEWYEIPLECLLNDKFTNLFSSGRIISSIDEAWEATRVIPVCVLTGEVAGLLDGNNEIVYSEIAKKIEKRGIKLHY